MRSAFTHKVKCLQNVSVGLGLALMLLSGNPVAIAKINPLPLDGTKITIKETSVGAAYSTTTDYAYANGEVFDRWVYSPWTVSSFTVTEQRIENPSPATKRALLTADLSIPATNLAADKLYALDLHAVYGCQGDKPTTDICTVDVAVNCYGYVADKWSRTFTATKSASARADGEFLVAGVAIDPAKCASGVQVSLRGNLAIEGKSFAFRGLDLTMKEQPKTTAKANSKAPAK